MIETLLQRPSLLLLTVSLASLALFLPATVIASKFRNRIAGRLVSGDTDGGGVVSDGPRHGWLPAVSVALGWAPEGQARTP